MPTPARGYRNAAGLRVPGTTTITGRFKESGGLIWWAWDLAFEPLMQARALLRAGNGSDGSVARFLAIPDDTYDYRKVGGKAADGGTCAHARVDAFIHKREFDPSPYTAEVLEIAKPPYEAFLAWADGSKLELRETEKALVSEKHQYGGTLDSMGINGKLAQLDWKTSKGVYPEYLCQLAAYGILWEENFPDQSIEGGYHLVRFNKQEKPTDPVQFSHYHWSHLDAAKEAFLLMRRLYGLMQDIEKQAK